tara:strand:- start:1395 stop:2312 length:918 start_codon:yes stop_codon:yes gene_type:complete
MLTFNLFRPIPITETLIINVDQGYGLNQVISILDKKELTSRPTILKAYVRIFNSRANIKTGEYLVSKDENIFKLIKKITEGSVFYRQIRLKEGSTFNEISDLFTNNQYIKKDHHFNNVEKIKAILDLDVISLEGQFHPDTYNYLKGDSYIDILNRSNLKHQEILEELWNSRSLNLPYKNSYEALILASLIEKEGIEKRQIAGVFVRRLQIGMKLQSDPTIIYALGKDFDGDIRRSDITMKHPYNTYHIKGLPPGPIGLVSKSSLEAAINPKEGTSLYFVAKGDGTHYFSDTLEEHNRAVRKYQLN